MIKKLTTAKIGTILNTDYINHVSKMADTEQEIEMFAMLIMCDDTGFSEALAVLFEMGSTRIRTLMADFICNNHINDWPLEYKVAFLAEFRGRVQEFIGGMYG